MKKMLFFLLFAFLCNTFVFGMETATKKYDGISFDEEKQKVKATRKKKKRLTRQQKKEIKLRERIQENFESEQNDSPYCSCDEDD